MNADAKDSMGCKSLHIFNHFIHYKVQNTTKPVLLFSKRPYISINDFTFK